MRAVEGAGPYITKKYASVPHWDESIASVVPPTFDSQESHSRCSNAHHAPGIGRSSRANQVPMTQRAFSRRPSFSARHGRCYFPVHSRPRLSHILQFFKGFFGLFVKEGFDGRAIGDYNEHRIAKSIKYSIDFAAKRSAWQRMIQRIIRPMLIAMIIGQNSLAVLLRRKAAR